jgi:hypothetical protein
MVIAAVSQMGATRTTRLERSCSRGESCCANACASGRAERPGMRANPRAARTWPAWGWGQAIGVPTAGGESTSAKIPSGYAIDGEKIK